MVKISGCQSKSGENIELPILSENTLLELPHPTSSRETDEVEQLINQYIGEDLPLQFKQQERVA